MYLAQTPKVNIMASLQLPNCKKKSAAHKNGFEVLVPLFLHVKMTLARPFYILALAHSWRGVAESFNFNKWCLKIKSPRHCTEHFNRIFWEHSWFYQHLESLLCKISVILSTFIYYIYFIKQFVPTIKSIFRIYLAVVALLSRTWTWTRAVSHCTMLIPAPFPFLLMLGMATKKNNKYQK